MSELQARNSWLNNAINSLATKLSEAAASNDEAKLARNCQNLECYMNRN